MKFEKDWQWTDLKKKSFLSPLRLSVDQKPSKNISKWTLEETYNTLSNGYEY